MTLVRSEAEIEPARVLKRRAAADCVARVGKKLLLGGRVQGLGVRPAIFSLATRLGLGGLVRNTERGVEVEIEGPPRAVERFVLRLPNILPRGSHLQLFDVEAFEPVERDEFVIVKERADGPLAARVPEDRAICDECLREIVTGCDRRYQYAFTSCTQCGPRYTVIRAMPFEREDTAMTKFPLCDRCEQEYSQPGDRRFHAQTTACPDCGPRTWISDAKCRVDFGSHDAITKAVAYLRAGRIVAVRGLGGYQLLVDATNQAAVERLRQRKGRRAKPLAMMVESFEAAEHLAELKDLERNQFCNVSAPIVVARARPGGCLAPSVHPQLDAVGLMRPTTPLHARLAREFGRPLVCTSGNQEGDPLEYEIAAAEERLAGIADVWLHHDREIMRPIDDSVVRVIAGRPVTIRLARGLAPLALDLPAMPPTLALGGYLKSAAAWSNGSQAVLGPHVGDQETLPARERYLEQLEDWQQLYRFGAQLLVHDLHPAYFSTDWARRQSLSTLAVQHHHAHIAAGMLEHGWLDRKVLGVAWDGTGYGTDGTIWGGEFLECTARSYGRVARLRPFRLPGGEAAIREPWRIAIAVMDQLTESGQNSYIARPYWSAWNVAPDQLTALRQIAGRPHLSPLTSSVGRLFDAAAAIILSMSHADFDGQAAMYLEASADRSVTGCYHLPIRDGELSELDWRPLFTQLLEDQRRGAGPGMLAMRFHRSLARGVVSVCQCRPELAIVLSGGVFQNRLLTELVAEAIGGRPQPLGLPGIIPPNDGGLAAGQLVIAAAKGNYLPCA